MRARLAHWLIAVLAWLIPDDAYDWDGPDESPELEAIAALPRRVERCPLPSDTLTPEGLEHIAACPQCAPRYPNLVRGYRLGLTPWDTE
jgi:hypothetical protein